MSNVASPIRIVQTDFRSGELDPRIYMRVDTKVYPSGARSLKNMLLRSTGAIDRRPGTLGLTALTKRSRLVEFEYDTDEKYILAFGDDYLRIYNPDGSTATTFSGADCPWDGTTMYTMTVAQQGDVMLICDKSFRPKKLTRTSLSTFTIADFAFDTDTDGNVQHQPHFKFESAATTMAISDTAVGAGRTLTSSPGIFTSGWVGARIRIFDCEILITGYTNATTCTATVLQEVKKKLDPNPLRSNDGVTTVEVTHASHGMATGASIVISGASTEPDPSIAEGNLNGTFSITVIDDDHYSFSASAGDVANKSIDFGGVSVTIKTTAGTREWTEPLWSDRRGWPRAVAFHQNRLWMGGATYSPSQIASSIIGSYYYFNLMDGEDDASIQAIISSTKFGAIRHMLSGPRLLCFTEAAEISVETPNGAAATPGNIGSKVNTYYGTSNLPPVPFDGGILFVQSSGKNVRDHVYDYSIDGFVSPSVSPAASHLVKNPHGMAIMLGTTERPEQYAFFANSDGTLSIYHSIRSEEMAAWSPFIIGGPSATVDDVCVLGTRVYLSVLRGATYYLEEWKLDDDDIWLDGSKQMSAASTVTWALGSVYASKTVTVMSNGWNLGTFTADGSGTITLTEAVTEIVAGYDPGIEVIPMAPDREVQDGPLTGEKRRVVSSTIHFHETVSLAANGQQVVGMEMDADFSEPPVQRTGKRKVRFFGYDRDPYVTWTQPDPGPLTILGMNNEVSY